MTTCAGLDFWKSQVVGWLGRWEKGRQHSLVGIQTGKVDTRGQDPAAIVVTVPTDLMATHISLWRALCAG